ncbi:MAG: hypothetical protein ACE5G2_08030 [Candidatus Krumholzibacteriia bacterium]
MASCRHPELKKLLYRHVRGELDDPAQRRAVDQHVQECAECRGVLEELEWVLGSMRRPTAEEHRQLMRELGSPTSPRHRDVPAEAALGLLGRLKRWLSTGGASRQ